MSRSRNPPPKGQGAARAKQVTPLMSGHGNSQVQRVWHGSTVLTLLHLATFIWPLQMGLLLDLNPDDGLDDGGNDAELEAELLQLMGGGARPQGRKSEGKSEHLFSFLSLRDIM